MVVHFLPKRLYIVFVYMTSNTFGELPANALLLMCVTFYVLMIYL